MADYWSAAASVAGALGGASIANQGSKDAQVKAIDYDYLMRDIGPWMQQRALKKAGLNPILAVNPGAMQNSAFPPTYTGAQPQFGDAASALEVDSKINEREQNVENMKQQILNMKESEKLTTQQIDLVANQAAQVFEQKMLTHSEHTATDIQNQREVLINQYLSSPEFKQFSSQSHIPEGVLKMIMFKLLQAKQ